MIGSENRDQGVGDLLHRITNDVRTIASDEIELAKLEMTQTIKKAAADAAVVMLGAFVALIGLALLCIVVVVALAPIIPALWLRLLIMAVIYLVAGGALAGVFIKRLGHDAAVPLEQATHAVKRIARDVELKH